MQLKEEFKKILGEGEAALMPCSYDRVGDILITTIPQEISHRQHQIGEALLSLHPSVKVVANRCGHHHGEFRTRPLRTIAGESRLTTLQRENGINLHLDLERMYYSVRSSNERLRIARLVRPQDQVAVLCSGAGPFPLVIGAHSKALSVIGIEKNPDAHQYALMNLKANRRITNVSFIRGDAADAPGILKQHYDRVISILPVAHDTVLGPAIALLNPGGTLHHYAMVKKRDTAPVLERIYSGFAAVNLSMNSVGIRYCGHCSPGLDRVCFSVTANGRE